MIERLDKNDSTLSSLSLSLPLSLLCHTVYIVCSVSSQVLSDHLERVLVLEDDIDFVPDFRERLVKLLSEAEAHIPGWDLM